MLRSPKRSFAGGRLYPLGEAALLRSPKRKLRETALVRPHPIPSARASGFKDKDIGSAQHTSNTQQQHYPMLRSPKRKLRETALVRPNPIPSARASGFPE